MGLTLLALAGCGGHGAGKGSSREPQRSILVSPSSAIMMPGGQLALSITAVNFQGLHCGMAVQEGSAGGSVSWASGANSGVYTAPQTAGLYHLNATAQDADGNSYSTVVHVSVLGN